MTRETKIGMTVAGSFLSLVGVVVGTKMYKGDIPTPIQGIAQNAVEGKKDIELPTPAKPNGQPNTLPAAFLSNDPLPSPTSPGFPTAPGNPNFPNLPAIPAPNGSDFNLPPIPNPATAIANAGNDLAKTIEDKLREQKQIASNGFDKTRDDFVNAGNNAVNNANANVNQFKNDLKDKTNAYVDNLPGLPPLTFADNKTITGQTPTKPPVPTPGPNDIPPLPAPPTFNPSSPFEAPKTITGSGGKNTTPPNVAPLTPNDPPLPPPSVGTGINTPGLPPVPQTITPNKASDTLPPITPNFNPNPPANPNFNPGSTLNPPTTPITEIRPQQPPIPNIGTPQPPPNNTFPPVGNDPFKNPAPTGNFTGTNPPPIGSTPFGQDPTRPPAPPITSPVPTLPGPPDVKSLPTNPFNGTNPNQTGFNPSPISPTTPPPLVPIVPSVPVVKTDTPERYLCEGNENYALISARKYGNDSYARALEEYNRDLPGAQDNVRAIPARLQPGTVVWVPSQNYLSDRYARFLTTSNIGGLPPIATPTRPIGNDIGLSPPTPLPPVANKTFTPSLPANADAGVSVFRVPAGGLYLSQIAERQLGSALRWIDIYRLNPTHPPEQPVREGTEIRIPAK